MLLLWDISIYVSIYTLDYWLVISRYDLDMILKKKSRWFVVRTFILKTSIIDDWLVAWLGYFHQSLRFFLALCFFAYI